MCLSVFVCVTHTCIQSCAHVWTSLWRPKDNLRCSTSGDIHIVLWDSISWPGVTIQPWSPKGPPVFILHPPSGWDFKHMPPHPAFSMGSGSWTQVLVLVCKHLTHWVISQNSPPISLTKQDHNNSECSNWMLQMFAQWLVCIRHQPNSCHRCLFGTSQIFISKNGLAVHCFYFLKRKCRKAQCNQISMVLYILECAHTGWIQYIHFPAL